MGVPMSQKSKRLKKRASREALAMNTRSFTVVPASINESLRSVDAVIATENPVREYDPEAEEVVVRTLLMSGVEIPPSRQIPLLDHHNRASVGDQLGSIRNLRIEGGNLVGTLVFAASAEDVWNKVKDGHITDVSAGFRVGQEVFIKAGETKQLGGRSFTGPQYVATKWRPFEGSLTPVGADQAAKLRGFVPDGDSQQDEEFTMDEELKQFLLTRGMPADLDDKAAQKWVIANTDKLGERKEPGPDKKEPEFKFGDIAGIIRKMVEEDATRREAARLTHRSEVDAICDLADVSHIATRCYDEPDLAKVRAMAKDAKAERAKNGPLPGLPRVSGEGRDTLRKDLLTAVVNRTFDQFGINDKVRSEVLPVNERGANAKQWQYALPMQLAEECIKADGFWRPGMSRSDIAMAAMGFPDRAGFRVDGRNDFARAGDGSYHTTGSFGQITENAVNKSMMAGYEEEAPTWELVFRRGASVPDFKAIRRYQLSAAGDLVAWPDDTNPQETSIVDSKETYVVEPYARALTYSYQLLINDDMGALTETPMLLGTAARRSENKIAWAPITANPLMRDGTALFSTSTTTPRFRPNLTTGAAVPTTTTVAAMRKQMRLMRGENTREGAEGPDILGLQPTFIVFPPSLEETVVVLTGSEYNPAASQFMTKNTARQLVPICEPLLEAASATAWYLFCKPSACPTVEVTYLQGNEKPIMWSGMEEKSLTRWFAIRLALGAKALDWRGMQKHAGA